MKGYGRSNKRKNVRLEQTIKAGCDESKLVKKTSPPNNSMEKPAMA
ncbi:MAG: hypothetical protein Q8844_02035 [Pigeon pea little leaf phytoplasma]|nr:hypothetical protein [Pigeon pea little leaf phytoplasma]